MPGQDCHGAVNLLRKYDSYNLMGESHGSECDCFDGFCADGVVETIGAADDEAQTALASVAESGERFGKSCTIQRFSAFIKRNQY